MLGKGNHIMLTIKILGSGCPNCRRLEAEIRAALDAANPGITYELIIAYGVMSTPALVMNEQVLSAGRLPKRDQIVTWARETGSA
jgi:hypothetical protein